MYLSRIQIDTHKLDHKALFDLMKGDAYANHQLLWRLFPNQTERCFLFRQELEQEQRISSINRRGMPLFYVLSEIMPQDVKNLFKVESKLFAPKLHVGQQLAFSLRANPVVAKRVDGKKHAIHHDVLMDAKQACKRDRIIDTEERQALMNQAAEEWLSKRALGLGFEINRLHEISGYRQHMTRKKQLEIQFSSIDYQGILTVHDPEIFKNTLKAGIGRAKAFGCGLMLIRRA